VYNKSLAYLEAYYVGIVQNKSLAYYNYFFFFVFLNFIASAAPQRPTYRDMSFFVGEPAGLA